MKQQALLLLLSLFGTMLAVWCGCALSKLDSYGDAGPLDYAFWTLPLMGTMSCTIARAFIRTRGHLKNLIATAAVTPLATQDFQRTLSTLGAEGGRLISEGKLDEAEALAVAARAVSRKVKGS